MADLAGKIEKSRHADSSCREALKATEVACGRSEMLADLVVLGEARIKRHQVAAETKGEVRAAVGITAKAKAAHDRIRDIESDARSEKLLLKERTEEINAEEFFACKR
jgi:hypothetical protein